MRKRAIDLQQEGSIDDLDLREEFEKQLAETLENKCICKNLQKTRILEDYDNPRYRAMFAKYIENIEKRWRCPACGTRYHSQEAAEDCCFKPDETPEKEPVFPTSKNRFARLSLGYTAANGAGYTLFSGINKVVSGLTPEQLKQIEKFLTD